MATTNAITAPNPVQELIPEGRLFADQTFHFEALRNVGYTLSGCADVGDVLETVKLISEGDAQGWYAAWALLDKFPSQKQA